MQPSLVEGRLSVCFVWLRFAGNWRTAETSNHGGNMSTGRPNWGTNFSSKSRRSVGTKM